MVRLVLHCLVLQHRRDVVHHRWLKVQAVTLGWSVLRRDVLRQSARQEYELARHEQDPELVSIAAVFGAYQQHILCMYLEEVLSKAAASTLVFTLQISRMIVSGRDAVHQVVDKVYAHAGVQEALLLTLATDLEIYASSLCHLLLC